MMNFTMGANYNIQKIGECTYRGDMRCHGRRWPTFVDAAGAVHHIARHHVRLVDRRLTDDERTALLSIAADIIKRVIDDEKVRATGAGFSGYTRTETAIKTGAD